MAAGKPDLSIIIISYNTAQITKNCLDSVIKSLTDSKVSYEIIVVDNASTDKSVDVLKTYTHLHLYTFKFIENKQNVGFAKANNQAVKVASGKYILFLNSDVVVLDQAVPKLLNYFQQNENKIQFLGGKLFEKDGQTPQPSCGPFYSIPVVFGALFLKGDYWGLTRYSPEKPVAVDWVSGACILTKKTDFDQLNGFDENIFMYMDEIDLLYRAKKRGKTTFFYPEAKFIHLASASSAGKTYPILQVYRGFLYFYRKYHPGQQLNLLKILLKLKAIISVIIGRLVNNRYLIKTYEEAYKLAEMAR